MLHGRKFNKKATFPDPHFPAKGIFCFFGQGSGIIIGNESAIKSPVDKERRNFIANNFGKS